MALKTDDIEAVFIKALADRDEKELKALRAQTAVQTKEIGDLKAKIAVLEGKLRDSADAVQFVEKFKAVIHPTNAEVKA